MNITDLVVPEPLTGVKWIEPDGEPVAVLGLNVRDLGSNSVLSAVALEFSDVSTATESIFEATDIAELNAGSSSGILIYKDQGIRGVLDAEDILVALSRTEWATDSLNVAISPAVPLDVPDTDLGVDAGVDFLIAVRASKTIEFGDRFRAAIPDDGVVFSRGRKGIGTTSGTLASAIPTYISDLVTGPTQYLETAGANIDVLGISAGDNGQEMILESLKVYLNDETYFQSGAELVFSESPTLGIPNGDPTGASTTIDVSPEFEYSGLEVYLDIAHTWRGEVRVLLLSPEGRLYTIYNGVVTDDREDVIGWFTVPLSLDGYRQAVGSWSLGVYDEKAEGGYVGSLVSWQLRFARKAGTRVTGFSPSDLMPVEQGGVALYQDVKDASSGLFDGVFNPGQDTRLKVQGSPYIGDAGQNAVLLEFTGPYPSIPDINDQTPDFFVVVRPSKYIGYNDRFSVSIRKGGIRYNRPCDNPPPDLDMPLNSGASEDSGVLAGRLNQPPYIRILEPDGSRLAAYLFRIKWEDFDLDDDAKIYLFFDTNDRGYDGKLVPGGRFLSEDDETDYLDWDISENNPDVVPGGRYWIYAIIMDDQMTYRSPYSEGYVQVQATNPEDYLNYVKLHNDGYVVSSGNLDILLGRNMGDKVATDLEVTPEGTGFFVLAKDGHIEYFGDAPDITMGDQYFVDVNSGNQAVALAISYQPSEIGFWDYGGYIATATGHIEPFGVTSVDLSGYDPSGQPGVAISDILLDLEQDGLYILYENGLVRTVGDAKPFSMPMFSAPCAVALRLTPSGNGLYMLDGYGRLYGSGDAGYFSGLPYYGGMIEEPARGFIVSPTNSGVAVMTGDGHVHPSDGVSIAKDYNVSGSLDDFSDIELVGGRKIAIRSILDEIYEAFEREDLNTIMQYISEDYFDENYNDREDLRNALYGFFDFYEIEQRQFTDMLDNPLIQVAGPNAYATVLEDWFIYVPSLVTTTIDRDPEGGGDGEIFEVLQDITIPFTQTVRWYINAEHEDRFWAMRLIVYHLHGEEYQPGIDEEVKQYGLLPDHGAERLLYYGTGGLNTYQYVFTEVSSRDGVGPFDVNWIMYDGDSVAISGNEALWEFALEDGVWRVTRTNIFQLLQEWNAAGDGGTGEETTGAYSGGFDFVRRAVIIDDEIERISDVRLEGGYLTAVDYPLYGGIVDMTLNVPDKFTNEYPTTFDEVTIGEVRGIPGILWTEDAAVVSPLDDSQGRTHIYAVKFAGTNEPFGLIRVLGEIGAGEDEEGSGIVFEWRYREDFTMK